MIKQFKDFDKTQAYSGNGGEQLPPGGYVCKIIGARQEEYSWGDVVVIAFDINEGEQKDFYKKLFDADDREDKKWKGTYRLNVPKDDGSEKDGWTKRNFKTFTDALEDSNTGYRFDWDETKFKGKLFGATFATTFYQIKSSGTCGTYTAVYDICNTDKIHQKKYRKIPELFVPKKLHDTYEDWKAGNASSGSAATSDNDFMDVPTGAEEEVPF